MPEYERKRDNIQKWEYSWSTARNLFLLIKTQCKNICILFSFFFLLCKKFFWITLEVKQKYEHFTSLTTSNDISTSRKKQCLLQWRIVLFGFGRNANEIPIQFSCFCLFFIFFCYSTLHIVLTPTSKCIIINITHAHFFFFCCHLKFLRPQWDRKLRMVNGKLG